MVRSEHPWYNLNKSLKVMPARRPQGAMLAYRRKIHLQRLNSNQSHYLDSGACMVLLIPKTCPGEQGRRLTLNKSTLLV